MEEFKNKKTKIPITIEIFQLVRNLLLSENTNIQHKDITEVKRFLSIIDFNQYTNTIENIVAKDYLYFLNILTDSALENNSISRTILIQNLLNESKDKEKFQILYDNRKEISNEDIFHLKKFMADHVNAAYIFQNTDILADLVTKIKTGNYDTIEEIVDEYGNFVKNSYKEVMNLSVKKLDERLDTGLEIDSLVNLAKETIKEISTPGYYLNTGFTNLDKAMNGGLKRGALTLFGAKTAGFKSGMMLNLACSVKLYSKHLQTFDKTKRPCVVYLSLENTQTETFRRMVTYTLNKMPSDLIEYDADKLAKEVLTELSPTTSREDMEFKILYKKSNSVDINDIYSIISDIEVEGFEVVALFVDYIATMKNRRFTGGDMNGLGLAMADNARELYDLAISKNIAVVSGFQLNRGAYDESSNKTTGKNTLKNVAESIKMTTYADYVFMINKEILEMQNGTCMHYIKFDEAKQRSNMGTSRGYFYEIFRTGNTFRLEHSKYYRNPKTNLPFDFASFDRYVTEQQRKKEEEKKNNRFNGTSFNRAMSNSISSSNNTQQIQNISLTDLGNENIIDIF